MTMTVNNERSITKRPGFDPQYDQTFFYVFCYFIYFYLENTRK